MPTATESLLALDQLIKDERNRRRRLTRQAQKAAEARSEAEAPYAERIAELERELTQLRREQTQAAQVERKAAFAAQDTLQAAERLDWLQIATELKQLHDKPMQVLGECSEWPPRPQRQLYTAQPHTLSHLRVRMHVPTSSGRGTLRITARHLGTLYDGGLYGTDTEHAVQLGVAAAVDELRRRLELGR